MDKSKIKQGAVREELKQATKVPKKLKDDMAAVVKLTKKVTGELEEWAKKKEKCIARCEKRYVDPKLAAKPKPKAGKPKCGCK